MFPCFIQLCHLTVEEQAEWGFVYEGEVLITAMDENGKYQIEKLGFGDVWYFPKGSPHSIQGLAEENECLLAFDSGDFDKRGFVRTLTASEQTYLNPVDV